MEYVDERLVTAFNNGTIKLVEITISRFFFRCITIDYRSLYKFLFIHKKGIESTKKL